MVGAMYDQIIAAVQRQLNFVFTLELFEFLHVFPSTQRAVATFTDS